MYATAGIRREVRGVREARRAAAINYRTDGFRRRRSRELTAGRGVDVILDIVGGDYLERNLEALAVEGRLVQIGLQGGASGQHQPARR